MSNDTRKTRFATIASNRTRLTANVNINLVKL